ncbi:ABATE domain-containing protein [Phytomonospora sp. NPDC050363]|uniref:CGNR zinc finger domain-containing protein n=1 Tax=Phytomonospora sp. NPDC050363 TaxID=3155642 RepID=UPI0033ED6611
MEIKQARGIALELALTIRHDGEGGIADDIGDLAGFRSWLREHAAVLGAGHTADERHRLRVVALRKAIRALFAHAVHPGPRSRADTGRLMSRPKALGVVNAAASEMPVVPVLSWPAEPVATQSPVDGRPLTAVLAQAAIAFLAGPDRLRLRACTAPRCVRYFVKEHNRQQWCKTSCGNRARVARHYEKQRESGRTGHKTPTQ